MVVVDLATLCAKFDYDWVINPIVDLVGLIGKWLSDISGKFDQIVVDGIGVLGTGKIFSWSGKQLRLTQTGQGQNYVLVLSLTTLALVAVYLIFLL